MMNNAHSYRKRGQLPLIRASAPVLHHLMAHCRVKQVICRLIIQQRKVKIWAAVVSPRKTREIHPDQAYFIMRHARTLLAASWSHSWASRWTTGQRLRKTWFWTHIRYMSAPTRKSASNSKTPSSLFKLRSISTQWMSTNASYVTKIWRKITRILASFVGIVLAISVHTNCGSLPSNSTWWIQYLTSHLARFREYARWGACVVSATESSSYVSRSSNTWLNLAPSRRKPKKSIMANTTYNKRLMR